MEKEKKKECKSFIRLLIIIFSIFIILLLSSNVSALERSIGKNLQVNAASTGLTCKQAGMCYCGGRDDSKRVDGGWCDLACTTTFNDCSPSFCECNCNTPSQCTCTSSTQCDDKKKCTDDICSSSNICTHVPIAGCVDLCDTLNCDDKNACTTDSCELESCKHILITCPILGQICSNQKCIPCVPQCSGKSCGPDSCGGSCGTCPSGYNCNVGKCVCIPKTCKELGKSCGNIDNGCGTKIDCGSCDDKNDCTYDSCDIYSGGCQFNNAQDGSSCNLGLASLSPWQSAWNSILKNLGVTGSAAGSGTCQDGTCVPDSCGDGKINNNEDCDPGKTCTDGKSCSDSNPCIDGSSCVLKDTTTCWIASCKKRICGDDIPEPNGPDGISQNKDDEECDPGKHCANGASCSKDNPCMDKSSCSARDTTNCWSTCKIRGCGDGVFEKDGFDKIPNSGDEVEECDPGKHCAYENTCNIISGKCDEVSCNKLGDCKDNSCAIIDTYLCLSNCMLRDCVRPKDVTDTFENDIEVEAAGDFCNPCVDRKFSGAYKTIDISKYNL